MKICHVITRLIVGGAQENTILTCRGLVDRGHDVTLMAGPQTGPEGSLWDDARAGGSRVLTIESLRREIHPLKDIRAMREMREMFADLRPEVVHTHSSKAGILGREAAARAGVPIIVHTIHGMSFNRAQTSLWRMIYRGLERRAARATSAFVTVADAMIEQSVEAGIAPRERFITIRSGMDTKRFAPDPEARRRVRRVWGVPDDAVVVGTVARLFDDKGYDEIIAAMPPALRRDDRLHFVWVGDGRRRDVYAKRLDRMGLRDRVTFVGLIPPDAVAAQLSGFDIVLHASRWEGLPRAVVQGMLTGVPAVCFDNDGAPEVVIPGETGILVPLGNVEKLAEGLVTLAADPTLRSEMGRRGRERCIEAFDWSVMVEQIAKLYEKLRGQGDHSGLVG